MSEPWNDVPSIFITLPRCPDCGHTKYILVRSEQAEAGCIRRKAVCRRCSVRFKIIVEPLPEFGNPDFDDAII